MVHVEHAAVADAAVVTTLWFEYMTHEAIPLALGLSISNIEAPVGRHLSWVCEHCLDEAPQLHKEQEVES